MKSTALLYGTTTGKTADIAKQIEKTWGGILSIIDVEKAWKDDFEAYDNFIIGASTWFDGELPTSWDELTPELEALNMKGKKVALFGLGDQLKYSDNFADGIGVLASSFAAAGAILVGFTSPDGYTFAQSRALKDGLFQGLVIDVENQSDKTDKRIQAWVKQVKKEFD